MALRPFALQPRRSRYALAMLSLVYLALVAAVLAYALPVVLLLGAGLAGLWALAYEGWLPGVRRVDALLVDAQGNSSVRLAGVTQPLTLGRGLMASPWLCVLNGRAGGKTLRLVLWPDSADPDALRRLRVYLRWRHDATTLDDKHADS